MTFAVGDLVVLAADADQGVLRVERLLEHDGAACARVLSYRDGRFSVHTLTSLRPCPPGTLAAGKPTG